MPLPSVDAVQLTRIEFGDCAAAVTPVGTVGAVVSAGGGGGAGGVELPPSPPPHADSERTNDASVADTRLRFMRVPGFVERSESAVNLTFTPFTRRRRERASDAHYRKSAVGERACRRAPRRRSGIDRGYQLVHGADDPRAALAHCIERLARCVADGAQACAQCGGRPRGRILDDDA